MSRVLLVLVLIPILLFLVVPVSANTALNFQQPTDFTAQTQCFGTGTGSCSWVQNLTGGNNYIIVRSNAGGLFFGIANAEASPMTYSACSVYDPTGVENSGVGLFDASKNALWVTPTGTVAGVGRLELKMQGNVAYFYRNGVEITHSGALVQNPSFVVWGESSAPGGPVNSPVDDIVWGSSEPTSNESSDKYVYGMPETASDGTPYYVIQRDFINPAANGFYFGNGTLIYSNKFYSTFSKGNDNSDTINLQGYTTGVNVLSNTTGTAHTGTIAWDLTSFFAANPNYGLYAMHSESSLKYSDLILYLGNGATISWDQTDYSLGETATITTAVSAGGYWNLTGYDYRVDVIDIYGVVDATYPITTQTAATSHTWDTDQDIGAYYAVIIAEPKDGSDDIWMAAALTNLDAYLTMHGYVFDAETELVIPNATVNITQGLLTSAPITPADGNYTVTGMSQGATINISVNATNYETYTHMFTPLRVGMLELNFTLMPTSPTYSGIALGGIAREPPYNRTINSARVDIQNTTDGHSYVATTNSVGYYIQNGMVGPSHWFNVWGSKTGFLNSTVYQKQVVGL